MSEQEEYKFQDPFLEEQEAKQEAQEVYRKAALKMRHLQSLRKDPAFRALVEKGFLGSELDECKEKFMEAVRANSPESEAIWRSRILLRDAFKLWLDEIESSGNVAVAELL